VPEPRVSQQHEAVVRGEFSRQADAMASAALFNDQAILARIREAAHATPNARILDVACGPGIVVEALAPGAAEVVGCDITPQMLEKARERARAANLLNVRFVPAWAEALPFPDASFDAVVSRSAVHHFPDPSAAVREMARVVRSGGRVVTVDVMAAESAEDAALHNALEILRDPSHVRMLARSELHRVLVQAGLEIASCTAWTNHREFGEWMKITNAPERIMPLKVVMTALARCGASAGIGLRLEHDRLLFDHAAGLTIAVKP
jgi:ubiquinone/menaquinone biosynthesis C-methylase UbiE